MSKYFLGSVGKAEAFRYNPVEKKMELAFVSKTLTDSGLNISTTKDDIRGGQGAPIQFSFYHDPSVEITLTDIQWKTDYVTAQLGAKFVGENEAYKYYNKGEATTIPAEGIEITDIKEIPGFNCEGNAKIAWACKEGDDTWFVLEEENGHYKLPSFIEETSAKYCVRYLGEVSGAMVAEISSLIIPEELHLIITAPLFAGDACAASRGKAAGEIQFDVPRFLLNGGQEFSMNMSSNQTMNLAGIALATESAQCDANGGMLLKIREIKYNYNYEDIADLVADPDFLTTDNKPVIYGLTRDATVRKAVSEDLTFVPALSAQGKWVKPQSGNKVEFYVTGNPTVKGVAYIE